MRCEQCHNEMDDGCEVCAYCGAPLSRVTVLTPNERESFHGVTIDQEPVDDHAGKSQGPFQRDGYRNQDRVFFKRVEFSSSGLLTRVIIALGIAFLMFVALPVAVVGVFIAVAVWWVIRTLFFN